MTAEVKHEHVHVALQGVSLQTDTGVRLLRGVTARFGPGLTAIMGPTGAGKTSLLNCIAGHVPVGLTMGGERRINGKTYTPHQVHFGYSLQGEELSETLTVEETLRFAAELMLAKRSAEQRERRVNELLRELGLNHVRGVLVGGSSVKGISGGQRKRVGIALALLTNPPLLLLDEPTAGLDSVVALRLIQTLKKLATEQHCTIIAVIHQPQRAIFELLDRLMLLRSAEVIYDGTAAACVPRLVELGHPYDGVSNPADFVMEVISPMLGESLAQLEARCKVRAAYEAPTVDLNENGDQPLPAPDAAPSRLVQFGILARRYTFEEARQYGLHMLNFGVTVSAGLLIGGVWFQLGDSQAAVPKRMPAIFFCAINQSLFSAIKAILSFPPRRGVMLREQRAKFYTQLPSFCAWTLIDVIFGIPWATLFAVITYFMIGLRNDAGAFFIYLLFMILARIASGTMAVMFCCITRSAATAAVVLPAGLELSRLFSGFFLPPALLPTHYVWLDPFAYTKYVYLATVQSELSGLHLPCPANATIASCNPKLGQSLVDSNQLDAISIGGCVGGICALIIGWRMIAYTALRLLKS